MAKIKAQKKLKRRVIKAGGFAPDFKNQHQGTTAAAIAAAREDFFAQEDNRPTERKLFNHRSHDYGIWFDYTGHRFKDYYSLELTDGTIVPTAFPNGDGWYIRSSITISEEEYQKLRNEGANTDDIPRAPMPVSPLIDVKRGQRIDDKDVKRVMLLADDAISWDHFNFNGVDRIIRNRRMMSGWLHPDEDATIGCPAAALAKHISLVFVERTETSSCSSAVRYLKPGVFGIPAETREGRGWFVNEGVEFHLTDSIEIDICDSFFPSADVPKLFRLFFQKGGALRLKLDVDCYISAGDTTGTFYAQPKEVIVLRQPRDDDRVWASLFAGQQLEGCVHFTFYHEIKVGQPPEGEKNEKIRYVTQAEYDKIMSATKETSKEG